MCFYKNIKMSVNMNKEVTLFLLAFDMEFVDVN